MSLVQEHEVAVALHDDFELTIGRGDVLVLAFGRSKETWGSGTLTAPVCSIFVPYFFSMDALFPIQSQ